MWAFHLKALRYDLWELCPPQLAVKILGEVLTTSLLHIEKLYSLIRPSSARLPQFRGDILGTLATVASLLPFLYDDADSLTSLHTHCWSLLSSLAVLGCNLDLLGSSMVQHSTPLVLEDFSQWRTFLDLSAFELQWPWGGVGERVEQLWGLVSAPQPRWDRLLAVLLNDDTNLAGILCHSQSEEVIAGASADMTMEGSLVYHLATVLSHCCHKPQALSMTFKGRALQ